MCDAPSQHTCESRLSEPLLDGRSRSNWTAWSGTSASRSESLFLCLLDLCGVSMVVRRVVPLCVRLTRFRGERGQICVALLMHGRFVRVCCVLSIVSVRWREQKLQLVLFWRPFLVCIWTCDVGPTTIRPVCLQFPSTTGSPVTRPLGFGFFSALDRLRLLTTSSLYSPSCLPCHQERQPRNKVSVNLDLSSGLSWSDPRFTEYACGWESWFQTQGLFYTAAQYALSTSGCLIKNTWTNTRPLRTHL